MTRRIGGPGVFPPQPPVIFAFTQSRHPWPESKGPDRYRRALYTHFWRATPHPALAVFDAPDAFSACTRRVHSNTPLQALTLLNDPTFLEASRVLATKLLSLQRASDDARLDRAYETALARPIKPPEQRSLEQFLALQREHYKSSPEEAKKLAQIGLAPEPKGVDETELAAWTQVCRVILNLHETITKY